MRVTGMRIERFGVLQEQEALGFSPGITCFSGRNEAGKSTCLAFFKAMLFGYRRGKANLDPLAKNQKTGGGTLFLDTAALGPLSLTRRPGKGAGPVELHAYTPDSAEQPRGYSEADLHRLMGNMSTEVFDNIFAFSLKNLMDIASLKGDNIRHALHGAAFGPGLQSPALVLKTLEDRMGQLLKRQAPGSTARINAVLDALVERNAALKEAEPELAAYARLERELRAGDTQRDALLEQRAFFEERLSLAHRVRALLAQKEEREQAVARGEESLAALHAGIAALGTPDEVARLYTAVQSLQEQKERRRAEAEELPAVMRRQEELRQRQQEILAVLGPGWDAARAAAADLSLSTSEAVAAFERSLEEQARAVEKARSEHALLAAELDGARASEQAAGNAAQSVVLEEVPLPDPSWTSAFEAGIKQARALLADMPRLREREQQARHKAAQALADIHPSWTAQTLAAFDASLQARQNLEQAAALLAEARDGLASAKRRVPLAEDALAGAEEKFRSAGEQVARYAHVPGREVLEARHKLLRLLERLVLELDVVRQAGDAANSALVDHLSQQQARMGLKLGALLHKPLAVAAAVCLLAGLALGGSGYAYDLPALLFAGLGLCGLGCAAGLAHALVPSTSAKADIDQEMALRRARNETESRKRRIQEELSALMAENALWLKPARAEEPEPAELSRAARSLEHLAGQLVLKEREEQELRAVERAFAAARNNLDSALRAEEAAAGNELAAQQQWRAYLQERLLEPGTHPHIAAGVFDKVGVARALDDAAREASNARANAEAAIAACLGMAQEHPFFAQVLPAAGGQGSFTDIPAADAEKRLSALSRRLEELQNCRDRRKERQRLDSIREERTQARVKLEQRLARAKDELERVEHVYAKGRAAWREWLAAYGLHDGLSPRTAAQALQRLESFAECAKEARALAARQADMQAALTRFATDIRALARQAQLRNAEESMEENQPLPLRVHSSLQLLDVLLARVGQAEKARTILLEKKEHLAGQVRAQAAAEQALAETDTALTAAQRLLRQHRQTAPPSAFTAAIDSQQHPECNEYENHNESDQKLIDNDSEMTSPLFPTPEHPDMPDWHDRLQLQAEEERIKEELDHIAQSLAELSENRGQLLAARRSLTGGQGNALIRGEIAGLEEELHALSRRWAVLALAKELLLKAKSSFEAEGQVGVIRAAGRLFQSITEGEYLGIVTGLEEDALFARHASGELRDPEKQLSQGAREQLYLSLRLAYVQNHAANAEPLPLIMDDILVNFDPQRAAATARVLARFARDNQILFFTCHPTTTAMLLEAGGELAAEEQTPPPAAFTVQRGHIAKA